MRLCWGYHVQACSLGLRGWVNASRGHVRAQGCARAISSVSFARPPTPESSTSSGGALAFFPCSHGAIGLRQLATARAPHLWLAP
eukprot:15033111-Alexandrium_andersonii.AAC.1